MEPASGKTLWSYPWENPHNVHGAQPLYHDGFLFLTAGYNTGGCIMLKVDGAKVEKAWDRGPEGDPRSKQVAPIRDGEHFYANSEGTLVCLQWPDGKVRWADKGVGLGGGGSFVRCGDKLVALTEGGKLELIQATPQACKLISQVQVFTGKENWSTPLVYRGRLYVKGPKELACFDIRASEASKAK